MNDDLIALVLAVAEARNVAAQAWAAQSVATRAADVAREARRDAEYALDVAINELKTGSAAASVSA